jgi:hypothetical protein
MFWMGETPISETEAQMTDHSCDGTECEVCRLARLVDRQTEKIGDLMARIEELKGALKLSADAFKEMGHANEGCTCTPCAAYHAAQAALTGDK